MSNEISLESERLILRTVSISDIDQVIDSINLDNEKPSYEEAAKEIEWMENNHKKILDQVLIHLCFAIVLKSDGKIIGWCGLDNRKKEWNNPVLFYLLKKAYWNNGFATEAGKVVLKYAFEKLNLKQIDAGVDKENGASKRVLEKIGMKYIGIDNEGGYSFSIYNGKISKT